MLRVAESKLQRILAWLPAILWAALIFFISAQPNSKFSKIESFEILFIIGHLVLYGVLMALLVLALRRGTELPANYAFLIAFVILALYAISDEFHQSFVPGRTATLFDLATDLVGAFFVWLLLLKWAPRLGAKPSR
jgi:VanZ family protein